MYFTVDGGYQSFLVFAPMLNSLTLDDYNNNKVTYRISTGISSIAITPFEHSFAPMSIKLTVE